MTEAVGSVTLAALKIYDKMVLITLLRSLLGLINHQGSRALFAQDYNSSILCVTLASQGWPDDLTTLLLWEKASYTIKAVDSAFLSYTGRQLCHLHSDCLLKVINFQPFFYMALTSEEICNHSNLGAAFLLLSCVHSLIHLLSSHILTWSVHRVSVCAINLP